MGDISSPVDFPPKLIHRVGFKAPKVKEIGLNTGYSVKDGALYHSMYPDDNLGEFQDGGFVPSRFLLELPPDCHRLAGHFALEYLKGR